MNPFGLPVRAALAAIVLCAGFAVGLRAQQHPQKAEPDPLTFEVASVKLSAGCAPECTLIRATMGNQGYHAVDAPLRLLMTVAYSITDRQITGGPAWMNGDRFDIEAKAERPHTIDKLHVMLQHLIEERFHLQVRHETREEAAWALVVAKGGPKMAAHDPADKDYPPTGLRPVPGSDGALCFEMPARNITMTYFAFMLSRSMGRSVVDRTGLPARYDFTLQFAPDGVHLASPNGGVAAISPDCSDAFAALPKQLGLKLEATKAPVEYLVVEHAEKPTEN
jgi:uncharacterized protein (TIGR03435 family)